MGSVRGRQDRHSRGRGNFLWHHQRQRVEPAGQCESVRSSPDFRFGALGERSVQPLDGEWDRISFPNGDPFPYTFNPKSPRFLLPASIESIGTNVQWPYIYQFNFSRATATALAGCPDRGVCGHAVARCAHDDRRQLRSLCARYRQRTSGSAGPGGYNARRPYDQNSTGTGTLGQNIFLITNQTAHITIHCRLWRAVRWLIT